MEKLASITTQPTLWQHLQNSRRLAQGKRNHSLMECITAALQTVWDGAGEPPDNVSKWQTYAELVQIIHELRM